MQDKNTAVVLATCFIVVTSLRVRFHKQSFSAQKGGNRTQAD
jgi:hypothetical protein